MYAATNANLRSGPGTEYDIVGSLSYAQEITVNGKVESGDKIWLVLKTEDGTTQMVSATLVSQTKPQPQQSNNNGGGNGGGNGNSQQPQQPQPQQPPADNSGGGQPSDGSGDGSVGFDDPNGMFSDLPQWGQDGANGAYENFDIE